MKTFKNIFSGIGLGILTLIFSCDNNNGYKYRKFGIKISLPDKWFVMGIDSTGDGMHSINCSAKGDDLTKVTINIENLPLDTTSFGKKVRTYKENMAGFSLSFTAIKPSTFNGNPSFKSGFNASTEFISAIDVKGYIESFQLKDKTITVLVLQNADESHTGKSGLDQLLKSIKLDEAG